MDDKNNKNKERAIPGRVIHPGVALGYAYWDLPLLVPNDTEPLDEETVAVEIGKIETAVVLVREHMEAHVRNYHAPAEEDVRSILAAHIMMLEDREFYRAIEERIAQQRIPAVQAVRECFLASIKRLSTSGDDYMRARMEDLRDLCQNIQRTLMFGSAALEPPRQPAAAPVYLSPYLHLSAVLRARRLGAVAYVTGSTAFTSHGAIILRASGIPSLGSVLLSNVAIRPDEPLLVDAEEGRVIIHATSHTRDAILPRITAVSKPTAKPDLSPIETHLPGGEKIRLLANINHPAQTELCVLHRLNGVGLLRTEFLALDGDGVPNEEVQYEAYKKAAENLSGRPLVIRTFDFGADKDPGGLNECFGRNPALGMRGIRRHLFLQPDELRQQLRAILRAAAHGDISILLPVVTNLQDVQLARSHLQEAKSYLKRTGTPHNQSVQLGAMVEIPSAALQIDQILDAVDFVSIGTNDLLQYLTASDRDNPNVLSYQQPDSSGLYRLLAFIMQTAQAKDRVDDVCVCGEMASDPKAAAALVKIGFRCLSVTPATADRVRTMLNAWNGHGSQEMRQRFREADGIQ